MKAIQATRRDALKAAAALAFAGCAPVRMRSPAAAELERKDSMNSRPLMLLRLTTSATQELGVTPHGKLEIFPVTGGSFEGDRLRGKVLAGGGDWVTAAADGVLELDMRVTLATDDGALIHLSLSGIRDDANGYFRTLPRFETAAPDFAFLNRLLAVGRGEIRADGPVHIIEEIL
jgi:hypothetical protein